MAAFDHTACIRQTSNPAWVSFGRWQWDVLSRLCSTATMASMPLLPGDPGEVLDGARCARFAELTRHLCAPFVSLSIPAEHLAKRLPGGGLSPAGWWRVRARRRRPAAVDARSRLTPTGQATTQHKHPRHSDTLIM